MRLSGRPLTSPGELILPTQIAVVSSALIVIDASADSMGIVLDLASGRVLSRFLADRGAQPVALSVDRGSISSFWVFDAAGSVTRYRIIRQSDQASVVRDSIVAVVFGDTALVVAGFADLDGSFVITGFWRHDRFARVIPGQGVRFFGPPPPGDADDPAEIRQHAFQTSFAGHPSRPIFAAATRYSDRLEVFAHDGSALASARRVRSFEPSYRIVRTTRGHQLRPAGDLRYGYLGMAASHQGIYALYSGRTPREAGSRAAFGALIEFYDWDAIRRRVYALDKDAAGIVVSESSHSLIALVYDRVPMIYRYDLP